MASDDNEQTSGHEDVLIVFTPSGKRGRFPVGTPVLKAARDLGVDIDSVCGGRGICGRCKVDVGEGHFSKHAIESHADHLSGQSETERLYEAQNGKLNGRRLSCSTQALNDVVIDVPAESQVHRQVVRKRAEVHDIKLNPMVKLHLVEVSEPDMHDPNSDLTRLKEALEFEWGLSDLTLDTHLLATLQKVLRQGEWQITVAIYNESDIIAIWPGYKDTVYGMSVDVGSTTIAAHLCNLRTGEVMVSSGLMNPQIRFGEDLMSRVSYVMMNRGGEQEMTAAVQSGLNTLFANIADEAGIDKQDILDVTLVGNPVMHHLLLGIDPIELGGAPFALALDHGLTFYAREIGLYLHPGTRAYMLPCIAGHVGADTAGVVLSEAPHHAEPMTLLVDVGTNAEIVLGNKEHLWACSSPTGPAFEGAQISSGQRAAPGAIERVRIDPDTLAPKFQIIGSDLWSDDPEFKQSVQDTGVTGICGSGIIEVIAEMYLAGIIDEDGVIQGHNADICDYVVADGRTYSYIIQPGSPEQMEIRITQNDVRSIQLAKAALYAGIKLLLDKARIQKVGRIRLAGAFGSHIDVKYAMILGLIPDCVLSEVTSAGNAAGTGARVALLDKISRDEIDDVVRTIEKIETAVEPKFQEYFVEAMAIPNKQDDFSELAKVVKLPERQISSDNSASDETGTRRRRRRRR